MRKYPLETCAGFCLLCLLIAHSCASAPLADRLCWTTFGMGAAKAPGCPNGWLAYDLSATWQRGVGIVTIQSSGGTELDPFETVEPEESAVDLGVLYGLRTAGRTAFASVSAGVAIVSGTKRGREIGTTGGLCFAPTTYESVPFTTVGVPLKLQLGLITSEDMGLGMDIVGDVNSQRSYYGAVISLMFGHLR